MQLVFWWTYLPAGGVFLLHYCLFSLIFRVDFCAFRFSVLRQFNLLLGVFVSSWFVMLSSSLRLLCFALLWTPICTFFGNKETGKGDWKSKEVYQKQNQVRSVQRVLFFVGEKCAKVAIFWANKSELAIFIQWVPGGHQNKAGSQICCMNSLIFLRMITSPATWQNWKQKNHGLGLEARATAAAAGLIDAQELLVAHPPAVTGDLPQEDLAKSG